MTGRVLVTGYGGFIGRHLCSRLLDGGCTVYGADLRDAKVPGVRHFRLDVSKAAGYAKLPSKIDSVVHLAAIASIQKAGRDYLRTYDINSVGAYHAAKYAAEQGAQFILASSSKVYGAPVLLPVDEGHPLAPANTYGRSKRVAEEFVTAVQADSGLSSCILRQFNVYGPGQSEEYFIPSVVSQLRSGDKVMAGDVTLRRDFLFVRDLVDAYALIIRRRPEGLSVYNVGGGVSLLLSDVVKTAGRVLGRSPRIVLDKSRIRADVTETYSGNAGLSKLGWRPRISLEDGIRLVSGGASA